MRSPVRALIWEQWRLVWWIMPIGIALTGVASIALHLDRDIDWYDELWRAGSSAVIISCVLLSGGILLFAHSSPTEIRAGIPARQRTLPIRRTTLALTQYLFRLGFIVALTAILTGTVTLIDSRYADLVLPAIVVSACMMSLALAAMWTIGTRSIGIAALCMFGVLFLSINAFEWAARHTKYAAPAVPIAVVLLSAVAAIGWASRTQRSARRITSPEGNAQLRRLVTEQRTPVQAQAWFDAHRRGQVVWVLAALVFGLVLLVFEPVVWQFVADIRDLNWYSFSGIFAAIFSRSAVTLIWLPPVISFASSICFLMLDFRDATLRTANFLFTRPISTADLVRARLRFAARTALKLCVPSFVLSLTLAAASFALDPDVASYPLDFFRSHEYPIAWLLSFAATTLLFWSAFPSLVAMAWLLVAAIYDLVDRNNSELVFAAIPVAVLAVAVVRAVRASRDSTWPRRFVALAFAIAFLFWLGTLYFESLGPTRFDDEILFAASAISALALYVAFSQPIWIDFLRHGGTIRFGKRPISEI